MKLTIFAFILSITLHILLFKLLVEKNLQENLSSKKSTQIKKIKSSVRYVRLEKIKQVVKNNKIKKVETKKIVEKVTKKTYKKVKAKTIKPQIKTKRVKKAKIIIQKNRKIEKKTLTKKVIFKNQKKRESVKKRSLEKFFLSKPILLDKNLLDDITKSYMNLYGEEYNSFTKIQKVFLQKHLTNIGKITQRYLKYPVIAVRTHQEGMNIVQFILYPNGDISDLKLINSSGYASLDKNTIKTVQIAYKDYRRPKTATKIKIKIYYKLY